MRDTESLVQIQVRHVATELARLAQADHCIHVRAIDVYLAAMAVHDVADFRDAFFEYAMRRWIRDHDCAKIGRMLVRLRFQVCDIDVAVGVARDHDHLHAGHLRSGRIGAMCRRWNQADGAMRFTTAGVIRANGKQTGVLALRTGIGLQRYRVVSGAGAQHLLQFGGQLLIAFCLVERRERMQAAELLPGHRNHFGRGIEFHRA